MDLYAEHILDHYRRPRNFGALENADIIQQVVNPMCGDQFELFLKFDGDRLTALQFTGQGCAISTAAASLLTLLASGHTLTELAALRDDDLLDEVGVELSPTRMKCALLAISGLRQALASVPVGGPS